MEKEVVSNPVIISEKGLISFQDSTELGRAAALAIKLNLAPEHLKKLGVEAVGAALLACKQYNLPQKAMGQMHYLNGRVTFYGSLVTAIAERHPDYGERKIYFLDEDQEVISFKNKNLNKEVWGCVILSKRKSDKEFSEFSFTKIDAEKAGLLNPTKNEYNNGQRTGRKIPNTESPWVKYTKDMYYHKANNRALKTQYSSVLEGIDYHEDVLEALERDVTPGVNNEFKKLLDSRENIENQG